MSSASTHNPVHRDHSKDFMSPPFWDTKASWLRSGVTQKPVMGRGSSMKVGAGLLLRLFEALVVRCPGVWSSVREPEISSGSSFEDCGAGRLAVEYRKGSSANSLRSEGLLGDVDPPPFRIGSSEVVAGTRPGTFGTQSGPGPLRACPGGTGLFQPAGGAGTPEADAATPPEPADPDGRAARSPGVPVRLHSGGMVPLMSVIDPARCPDGVLWFQGIALCVLRAGLSPPGMPLPGSGLFADPGDPNPCCGSSGDGLCELPAGPKAPGCKVLLGEKTWLWLLRSAPNVGRDSGGGGLEDEFRLAAAEAGDAVLPSAAAPPEPPTLPRVRAGGGLVDAKEPRLDATESRRGMSCLPWMPNSGLYSRSLSTSARRKLFSSMSCSNLSKTASVSSPQTRFLSCPLSAPASKSDKSTAAPSVVPMASVTPMPASPASADPSASRGVPTLSW
mmetsp:Transcript_136788/g.381300  ORF Transcript_136788/g.381300 Transcript_136788/m.381300 type:complete len:446 (+) Transcript_136788:172-1509(+)